MEAWCDHCGERREVVKTVSWQSNLCAECGNPIEETEE